VYERVYISEDDTMHNRLMRIPIAMIWFSAIVCGLKLAKVHLIQNSLFDAWAVQTFRQIVIIFVVAFFSAFLNEAILLIEFLVFGDDDA